MAARTGPEAYGTFKWVTAADLVRQKIADGKLWPGGRAPSSAALARETGFHVVTCRRALRELVRDGVLVPGVGATGRPRVARPGGEASPEEELRALLSRTLAARRRGEGLTQEVLAAKLGVCVTTVGHAETGCGSPARSGSARTGCSAGTSCGCTTVSRRASSHQRTPPRPGRKCPPWPPWWCCR
jgi:hypothetical protein